MQVVCQIPAAIQAHRDHIHELALGADALEKHDELELEEDDWIDTGSAKRFVEVSDQIADEAQVEFFFDFTIEVVLGNK